MEISILVAAAENDTIGASGGIPWNLPDDLRHFKALTLGHHIVMGRRTHESIGRLLPGRTTIVISTRPAFDVPGAAVAKDFDAALEIARKADESEVFVVGGERAYAPALLVADRIHLTRVHTEVDGDTHFPSRDTLRRAGYHVVGSVPHPADDRHAHAFTIERWERHRD